MIKQFFTQPKVLSRLQEGSSDPTFQYLPLPFMRKAIQEPAFGVTYAPPITLESGSPAGG
jgi:hypothetical protein